MSIINLASGVLPAQAFTENNVYVGNNTVVNGLSRVTGNNVELRGIKFTNGGVRRDGKLSGLIVDGCDLADTRVGVEVNGGSNVTIRKSLFQKCSQPTWIADVSDLSIINNELTQCGYGFKVFGDSGANKNWLAKWNHIHHCGPDFMGFEFQGQCANWAIDENLIELLTFGPTLENNDHSLLISAPMAKANGPGFVRRNAVLGKKPKGPGYPDAWINGAPAILEIGGTNTLVESNLFDGGGVGVTCTDRDGPATVTLRDNRIVNVYTTWNKNAASQVVTLQGFNGDGPLPWTLEALRKLVGRSPGSSVPVPDPVPTIDQLKTEIIGLKADNIAKGTEIALLNGKISEAIKALTK